MVAIKKLSQTKQIELAIHQRNLAGTSIFFVGGLSIVIIKLIDMVFKNAVLLTVMTGIVILVCVSFLVTFIIKSIAISRFKRNSANIYTKVIRKETKYSREHPSNDGSSNYGL